MLENSLDLCCALHVNYIQICGYNITLNSYARLRLTLLCPGIFFSGQHVKHMLLLNELRADELGKLRIICYNVCSDCISKDYSLNDISVVLLRTMRLKRDLILLVLISLCVAQKKSTQETWENRGNSFLYRIQQVSRIIIDSGLKLHDHFSVLFSSACLV